MNRLVRKNCEFLFFRIQFFECKLSFGFFREKLKRDYPEPYAIHFDSYFLPKNSKGTMSDHLYPYHSVDLAVLFVYGTDFEREMSMLLLPESVQTLNILIVIFLSVAATILCIIRKRLQLRRDGFISTFIDTMVAFTSGGRLQMRHRWEKWFFAILLFAAFFISSLYTGDVLFYIYRILDQKIDTFKQLAMINAPIYIIPSLRNKFIFELLRFVLNTFVLIYKFEARFDFDLNSLPL